MEALSDYSPTAQAAKTIIKQKWVRPNKRIFDNSKVSDHFAIVPTGQLPKSLSEPEQKLFELVCRRFLAIFFPSAEYLNTTRITKIDSHAFKTEGKVLVSPGWLTVYGKEISEDDDRLVAIAAGDTPKTQAIDLKALQTKPPARYTEATLLSAMEGAGKLVDDDDLREALAGKGLGTPATRAAIIEGLLSEKYLIREARELLPTAKAFQLMTLLRGLDIQALSKPALTGEWEFKLRQIEEGQLSREAFMQDIAALTGHMVEQAKNHTSTTIPGDYATLQTPCPSCGGVIKENYRRYACGQCEFSITKIPGGRTFELHEVEQLIQEKHLGPLDGFRSKIGRPFAASLKLTDEHKLEFDFGPSLDDELAEVVDFSGQPSLGPCPKCASPVHAFGSSYVCSKAAGPDKTCDFKSGVMILQQTVAAEQMEKLLRDGRTDLLDGFVSSRTKRRFKAYLVKTPEGKVGFEFEARAPAKAGAKPKRAKKTA
jgi:DNA topoisomerase-3